MPPARESCEPGQPWGRLSPVARVYVSAVCGIGVVIVAWALQALAAPHPALLGFLVVGSVLASTVKVSFPRSMSTLTLCQVLDYLSLLLIGPHAAVLVAVAGGWGQCTLRSRRGGHAYQTLFNISCLAVAIQSAGAVYVWLGGQPGAFDWSTSMGPFTAAASVFFLVNSGLIAVAIGLSTEQSTVRLWWETCLWSWPGYLFGAAVAAAAVAAVRGGGYWLVPFLVIPLALTFHNLRAYLERLQDAQTDPLTRLPNQRVIMSHLSGEVERARQTRTSFAVVIVDVDQFKSINDTHGHRVGDLALNHIAGSLRRSLGSHDVCARYAGDEFLLTFRECDEAEAARKGLQLQWDVAARRFEPRRGCRIPLAISVGVALFPDDGQTSEQLLDVADARMYENKRNGSLATRAAIQRERMVSF